MMFQARKGLSKRLRHMGTQTTNYGWYCKSGGGYGYQPRVMGTETKWKPLDECAGLLDKEQIRLSQQALRYVTV